MANDAVDLRTRLSEGLEDRYRVEEAIGQGGMAEVFSAFDLRHHRKVAVKVLRRDVAARVGAERFLAEVRTTAGLQHPHILPLFDSGEADGLLFYVMPLVEGESLRERLERESQLPVEEAVRIVGLVAEALDYAHRRGVVHRDIKPANILLHDGQPVIADFGIALAVDLAVGGRLTETGMSVGTPAYMSPEQATGEPGVGPAADVYALGCVLYEMLAGEPPFTGRTPQAILGKIITGTRPSVRVVRSTVPRNVDAAIHRALEKVPADRFHTAADFGKALVDPSFGRPDEAEARSRTERPWQWLSAASLGLAAVLGAMALWPRGDAASGPSVRTPVALPEEATPRGMVEVSADGMVWVYEAAPGTEAPFFVWRRDALQPTVLSGTEGGRGPALSFDGREVAYLRGSSIRVTPVGAGPSRTLLESEEGSPCCLRWALDGASLYFTRDDGSLARISAAAGGATVESVIGPEEAEAHVVGWLGPLPGGRGAVFQASQGLDLDSRIMTVEWGSGVVRELAPGRFPRYADGFVVFAQPGRGDVLVAMPFDAESLESTGPARVIAEEVAFGGGPAPFRLNPVPFALTADGLLVYNTGWAEVVRTPVWVARDGTETPVDTTWVGALYGLALSPDGTRLAASDDRVDAILVKELDRGPLTHVVLPGASLTYRPSWSPAGDSVVFTAVLGELERLDAFISPADGRGPPASLDLPHPHAIIAPDGQWLVYRTSTLSDGADILAVPRAGGEPRPLVSTAATEVQPALSPDGRYLAYTTNASGRYEVYVRPFPDAHAWRVQISTAGGHSPVWSHGGGELFYHSFSDELVAVRLATGGATVTVEGREVLFNMTPYSTGDTTSTHFDITPDDRRFIMPKTLNRGWLAGPRQLVILDDVQSVMGGG